LRHALAAENPARSVAPMTVTINGERREVPEGLTVAAMLEHLGMADDRVAIERNFDILPRQRWRVTQVQANDSFEIVHFVGGG
jgi:sulfur carrier protein